MQCYALPYEGNEDYLFFSYCHEDEAQVYPIIERLAIEGFRVWYDNGIHAGEEWPEVVANHLINAKACVISVSKASAESHNCRNELSYAVGNNKPMVSIVLESFLMSKGTKLLLSSSRYLNKYEMEERAFYSELLSAQVLNSCQTPGKHANEHALQIWAQHKLEYSKAQVNAKSEPGGVAWPGPIVEQPKREPEPKPEPKLKPEPKPEADPKPKKKPRAILKQKSVPKPKTKSNPEPKPEPKVKPKPEPQTDPDSESAVSTPKDPGATVYYPKNTTSGGGTEIRDSYFPAILVRMKTEKVYLIKKNKVTIGRLSDRSDIALPDNKAISGAHVEIYREKKKYFLRNLEPKNDTEINGAIIEKKGISELQPSTEIALADDQFLLLYGRVYDRVFDDQKICILKCKETGETKVITEDPLPLDRNHKWRGNILGDMRIHRAAHASVFHEGDGCCLQDMQQDRVEEEQNPIYHNGRCLAAGEKVELRKNDVISVVDTEFIYYEIEIGAKR